MSRIYSYTEYLDSANGGFYVSIPDRSNHAIFTNTGRYPQALRMVSPGVPGSDPGGHRPPHLALPQRHGQGRAPYPAGHLGGDGGAGAL